MPPGGLFFKVGALPHPALDVIAGGGSLELVASCVALGSGPALLPSLVSLTSLAFEGACDGLESPCVSLSAVSGADGEVVGVAVVGDIPPAGNPELVVGGTVAAGFDGCAAVVVLVVTPPLGAVMPVGVPSLGPACGCGLVSALLQPAANVTPATAKKYRTHACMVPQVSRIPRAW